MGRASKINKINYENTDTSALVGGNTSASINEFDTSSPQPYFWSTEFQIHLSSYLKNFSDTHIASLNNNINNYQKECKKLQTEAKEYLKEVYTLKGKFDMLFKIYWVLIIALIGTIVGMVTYHLKAVVPLLSKSNSIKQEKVEQITNINLQKSESHFNNKQ